MPIFQSAQFLLICPLFFSALPPFSLLCHSSLAQVQSELWRLLFHLFLSHFFSLPIYVFSLLTLHSSPPHYSFSSFPQQAVYEIRRKFLFLQIIAYEVVIAKSVYSSACFFRKCNSPLSLSKSSTSMFAHATVLPISSL